MALESVVNIADFTITNPTASDPKSQGDDHIRNIKTALKNDFAGFTGAVMVSGVDGGAADVYTLTPANAVVAYTPKMVIEFTPAATSLTTTPTMNISGLGAKTIKSVAGGALLSGDLVIGCYYLAVYDGTYIRLLSTTQNYADQLAFTTALPAQAGNSGKYLKTDGATASWAAAGIATAVTDITTSTTLTASTIAYHTVAMTSPGLSVTLPDATTLTLGAPKALFKNTGGYPFGIRDSAGTLLMAVAAGGMAYVSLDNTSTAAGSWGITGSNLDAGLITIDSTFSSTYLSTSQSPFVAFDSSKSLHFALLSSGFAAFAVDNTTGAVGTPVTVSAVASMVPRIAFKITSTTAMVFYSSTTGTLISVVISLSGATTLAIGTPSATLTATGCGVEDFHGAPKIAQLDSTHYIVSYATATGAGSTSVAAWEVTSGTTTTLGSAVDIIAANNCINSTATYALTATTALILYKSGAAAPYANPGVVVSVAGTVCTVATPTVLTGVGSSLVSAPISCLLSATSCIVSDDNNTAGSVIINAFTIAGTVVTAGTLASIETGITTSLAYTSNSATRYTPHLLTLSSTTALMWYFNSAGVSREVVITNTAGTISKGTILYNAISEAAQTANHGGSIVHMGTSDFLSLKQVGSANGNWTITATPHKISGTNVTVGSSTQLPQYSPVISVDYTVSTRLSQGDYLLCGTSSGTGGTNSSISILRTNGDAINNRGVISTPVISGPGSGARKHFCEVSSNRIVVLGGTIESTINSLSTYQLRLLNIEVAA